MVVQWLAILLPVLGRTGLKLGQEGEVLVIVLNNDMGCTGEADLEKTQAFILSQSKGVWA